MDTLARQQPIKKIQETAAKLRRTILEMVYTAGSGHLGGSFSVCEILAVLYYAELRLDPTNPRGRDRDRFILSKGHAAPALYAVLAERGFFNPNLLQTLRAFGSILQGHPDCNKVPGVEISTGSLGMGISYGIGTALAGKYDKLSYRTYVLTGCGELDEGQNWEAFLTGAKYQLDNLAVIVDFNRVQLDGSNTEILPLDDLVSKIQAFNWHVLECDGHSVPGFLDALEKAHGKKGKPTAIIAYTVKGKGVSFMEGKAEWHGKSPNAREYKTALMELNDRIAKIKIETAKGDPK